MDDLETIVIGAGPAGMSAALMLGRSRRRVRVIDAGRPRNRFASHIHGLLGNEDIAPAALHEKGVAELAKYGVSVQEGEVREVRDERDALLVELSDGSVLRARAVVVATGLVDELPAIPGLAERWGRTVVHCPYCHGWEVRELRLGVLVTSPPAVHQAQLVRQLSDSVTVLTPTPLDDETDRRLRARGFEIVVGEVVEVVGEGEGMTGVRLGDGRTVPLDALFAGGRPVPLDGFLDDLRLDRAEAPFGSGSFLATDAMGRTSHPRIWAVGNVAGPAANVPGSIGTGSFVGAAVNGALVEEEFDRALAGAGRG